MSDVLIRDVLPRDGFQDRDDYVSTPTKIAVIERLHAAGVRWIEVTSLVHPDQVPQFRDADAVLPAVRPLDDLRISVFAPNRRGVDRAASHDVDEVSLAVATTDPLARSNFKRGREQVLRDVLDAATHAMSQGMDASVTIGGSFGCPFEGAVPVDVVLDLFRRIAAAGVRTIFLADTIGTGTADSVGSLVAAVRESDRDIALGVHLHGGLRSLDAVDRAVAEGATLVDTSTTGAGGCPFVPSAPGNVPTEAVVPRLGSRTTLDAAELTRAAEDIRAMLSGGGGDD